MLPCALVLWSSAIVLRTGSLRALLAGGAAVGVAASLKYSDGAVVIALVAAAFLSPELSFKRALGGLAMAGAISLAVVIVTNPYLFADWGTFTHDLDRQRKFADGPPLLGQPERNGWAYYVTSSRWALGIIPGLLALAGGVLLVVKGRRREALVLGSLVVLYWLYMGSQSRFYARWMLPLYPTLAILAAYAATQIKQRVVFGIVVALALIPSLLHDRPQRASCSAARTRAPDPRLARRQRPEGHQGGVRADRPDRVVRGHARRWAEGRPRPPVGALQPQPGDHRRAGAGLPRRALSRELPELRAHAQPGADRRLPARGRLLGGDGLDAVRPRAGGVLPRPARRAKYYSALRKQADVVFRTSPVGKGEKLPRYQVDRSFNYVGGPYERPGPEMIVYKLRDCA